MMKVSKAFALLFSAVATFCSLAASATTVTVEISNNGNQAIALQSSSGASGLFPATVAPNTTVSITVNTLNSSSSLRAVYARTLSTGLIQKCEFKGSHTVTGSTTIKFDKSATSTGTQKATCIATQTVQKWSAPHDYRLSFDMY